MSNTLSGGRSVDLNVQAGQSLKVTTISGTYTAIVLAGAGAGSALATDSASGATYGPYTSAVTIRVKVSATGFVDYDVGAIPSLDYKSPAYFGHNADGDISSLVDGAGNVVSRPKKRSVYPVNLMDPRLTGGYVQTLGTASEVAAATENGRSVVTCVATAAGSTARILKGWTALTLDTSKNYELSCTVVSATFGNAANMAQPWLGLTVAPTAGAQTLDFATNRPVTGQRYSMRFQPAAASNIIRVGLGINSAENVLVGDSLVTTDFSLYEIPALASVVSDYSYASTGHVGRAQTIAASPASCVWAIGDSWSNDAADWPVVLGLSAGREIKVTATGGNTLGQMKTAVDAAAALGIGWLFNPNQNKPGVAVICGGINNLTSNSTITTITAEAQVLIDYARARNIVPLFVLQPFATDGAFYTAPRAVVNAAFVKYITQEGVEFINTAAEGFLNSDGTANTTNMLSETGNWIHPSAAGVTLLVSLIEKRLREIDRGASLPGTPDWP